MQPSILAIIPARGGSKGIPGKNIKHLFGQPLIHWSISQAVDAKRISRVFVSTDDPDIAKVAQESGAEVPFLRPDELASDTASTEPVLIHTLDWLWDNEGYIPDYVMLLQPTSPMRAQGSLDEAVQTLLDADADSLLSVVETHHFHWKDPASPKALYDYRNRPRRQDIKPEDKLYQETGSIYITRTDVLRSQNNRLGGNIVMYVTNQEDSFEIDTMVDWLILEQIFTEKSIK